MASTGVYLNPLSGMEHQLNTKVEVNNFATTVMGSVSYSGGHAHEDLEITVRTVTV